MKIDVRKNIVLSRERQPLLRQRLRSAISLLEITFVLFIFVALIVGAMIGATVAFSNNETTRETQNIMALSAAITKTRTVRHVIPPSAQLGPAIYQMGLIPLTLQTTDGTVIKHGWGGDVILASLAAGAGYGVGYTNIPMHECANLVNSVRSGPLSWVGPGSVLALSTPIKVEDMDSAQASQICNTGLGDVYWANIPQ